jgi:hypothetical protein
MGPARTLHSALPIPARTGQALHPLPVCLHSASENEPIHWEKATPRQLVDAVDVLICDEVSMMTQYTMYVTLFRMQHGSRKGCRRKLILCIGDHGQLPPIWHHVNQDDECVSLCRKCHLIHSVTWQQSMKFHFTTVFRTAGDSGLLAFLNTIRMRAPTTDEIMQTLQTQFWSPTCDDDFLRVYTLDTQFLCAHVQDTIMFNQHFLHWLHTQQLVQEIHKVNMHSDVTNDSPLLRWRDNKKFHQLPCVPRDVT